MAYSTQRSVSDGTLQLWLITIDFFDQSEMSFYFDDVPTTAYTWATATSVLFDSPVPNGVEALARRTTDISEVRHVFSEGAQFKDETLDDDFRQILHIAQEAVEGANVGDIFSTLNMHGNKITNVGTAVDPGDAISFGQVITESESAFAASIAAQAAASSASSSAATASTQAGIATTAAGTATTQAGIATTQAGIATTQAGLATTNGASQVALATTQANNAAASASTASTQAGIATTQAGIATTQAGLADTARIAAEAARDAAAASAASVAGVGRTYMDGLQLVWVGNKAVTITAGSCRLPNGGRAFAAADIALTGLTTVAGFNHFYVYDSGSGVMAAEVSSTIPVKVTGTMYQKTGDNTRRYVGSALGVAVTFNLFPFLHRLNTNEILYTNGDITVAQLRQVNTVGAPTVATRKVNTAAPVETATELICSVLFGGAGNLSFGISEQANPLSSIQYIKQLFAANATRCDMTVPLSRQPGAGTLGSFDYIASAGSTNLVLDAAGYRFER